MTIRKAVIGFAGLSLALASCVTASAVDRSALLDATRSAETAPEVFRVRFETSRGPFVIEAHRAWAPWGVDRFYYLARHGFYDGNRFFRVLPGYLAQFGINGDPQISSAWVQRIMPDDTVAHQSNLRGRISYGSLGPHTRMTQLFVNLRDNPNLDKDFGPIGEVVEGMSVIESLFAGYGDGPPNGTGPVQDRIQKGGDAYLARDFPKLDYIKTARLIK